MAAKQLSRIDEKKSAGASYILEFYQTVLTLQECYARYINVMIEVQNKTGVYDKPGEEQVEAKSLTDQEKQAIVQWIQETRATVTKSYLMYLSLGKALKWGDDKNIHNHYNEIVSNFVIPTDELRHYVVELNNILISDVIQEILQNSQGVISDLYGHSAP